MTLVAALLPLLARAQAPDGGALLRELQQQAQPPAAPVPAPALQASPERGAVEGQATVRIRQVLLEGLSAEQQAPVLARLAPLLAEPYTVVGLQRLADEVAAYFRERGTVVQAWLPAQTVDEDAGQLTIAVLQARLGGITVDDAGGRAPLSALRARDLLAAQIAAGELLDTRALEQGLRIINGLPGVRAAAALEPGARDGQTDVVLTLEPAEPARAQFELRNPSNRSSGTLQASLSASFDGPRRAGDQAAFFLASSQGMDYAQASYTTPWGLEGVRWGLQASQLAYRSIGEFRANGSRGRAWTLGTSLSVPEHTQGDWPVRLSLALDFKGYDNHNLATDALISHFRLTVPSITVQGQGQDRWGRGGQWGWTLQASMGDTVGTYPAHVADMFLKFNASAQRVAALSLPDTQLQLSVQGQWADGNLSSSEQMFLGGPTGIRAYPGGQGAGSEGWLATAELRRALAPGWTGQAFVDAGGVRQYRRLFENWQGLTGASNTYTLAGWGLGLQWLQGPWQGSASVAWRIGENPLLTQKGERLDNDNTRRIPRAWLSLRRSF